MSRGRFHFAWVALGVVFPHGMGSSTARKRLQTTRIMGSIWTPSNQEGRLTWEHGITLGRSEQSPFGNALRGQLWPDLLFDLPSPGYTRHEPI